VPSVEPTSPPIAVTQAVQEQVLQEGEAIIFALRPSGWFMVLISMPVLGLSVMLAAAVFLTENVLEITLPSQTFYLSLIVASCARLLVAGFQWMARLYILTNRRVIRIRGTLKMDLFDCPLKQISGTTLTTTTGEKLLSLSSLYFNTPRRDVPECGWINLSRPGEVKKIVDETIAKAK